MEIGYAKLRTMFGLERTTLPPQRIAKTSTVANQRIDQAGAVLFPVNVTIEDTPVGQLEFALRNEGVDLAILAGVFEKMPVGELIAAWKAAPNGQYIRRACALWEWTQGKTLEADVRATAAYIDMIPAQDYVTRPDPPRRPGLRVYLNAPGPRAFCPLVSRQAMAALRPLDALLDAAVATFKEAKEHDPDLYARAMSYLYLSETRSSFAIEKELPSANKAERFVRLLRRAGDTEALTEELLVAMQNEIVTMHVPEASYRTGQNWLEDSHRLTFLPPSPAHLRDLMAGWEDFINNSDIDLMAKLACAAFGFVYLHPFYDGNGRLHRFLIHRILAQSGKIPPDIVVPVSAVILKELKQYGEVLKGFSAPVTALWDYRRGEPPDIVHDPGPLPYRYWFADRETAFLNQAITLAVEREMPQEMAYLQHYDAAIARINSELDVPNKDLSTLVRAAHDQRGKLSRHRRKQFFYLPENVLDRIEEIVAEVFEFDAEVADDVSPRKPA